MTKKCGKRCLRSKCAAIKEAVMPRSFICVMLLLTCASALPVDFDAIFEGVSPDESGSALEFGAYADLTIIRDKKGFRTLLDGENRYFDSLRKLSGAVRGKKDKVLIVLTPELWWNVEGEDAKDLVSGIASEAFTLDFNELELHLAAATKGVRVFRLTTWRTGSPDDVDR